MHYLIKHFSDYDPTKLGTPWGAPSDSTGRPCFKGKVAHYTGGRGKGGDLFAEDPVPFSVWVFGQKNYVTGHSQKEFAQFDGSGFHNLSENDLLSALKAAPQVASSDKRRDEIIRILLKEICQAEKSSKPLSLSAIMRQQGIAENEVALYGINIKRSSI